jgi:prolyl 4-hydroxylase
MPPAMPSPELALAQRHDADGRYDDAINELARGTAKGDLPCMRQLGKRLLTGENAPLLAADGARFLLEAANKGDAEAAARTAALTALGLYRAQSWTDALRWLTVAAERGLQNAQEQLTALATDAALANEPTRAAANARLATKAPPANHWQRLASEIDLAAWQTSPTARDLCVDPQVRTFEGFISASVCQWIIDQARGRLVRARVYDAANSKDLISVTRTNSAATRNLAEVELLDLLLQARMSAACRIPMRNMEAPAVLHYAVGEQITDHFDFVDPDTPNYTQELARNGQRVVTFLVYLNDDYEGGVTGFPTLGFSHKGRRGEGLYFVNALPDMQPDLRMLHTGSPPTRGEKWIVSQFIRSRETIQPR